MKGSLEGVLPMLGLLIISGILAMQTLPIAASLNEVASESAKDLGNLAETRVGYDSLNRYYIEDSQRYGVNNAAYELEDGGIDWKDETSSASEPHIILESVLTEWESKSHSRFSDRIENHKCDIDEDLVFTVPDRSGLELYDQENVDSINSTAFTLSELSISCNEQTEYITESLESEISIENRYVELAKASSEFFYGIENTDFEEEIEDEYVGTSTDCGEYDDEGAEDDAFDSYSSDTLDASDIGDDISKPSGIILSYSSSDQYSGEITDRESYGECGEPECDGSWEEDEEGEEFCDGELIFDEYKDAEYTLNPDYSSYNFEAVDDSNEVLVYDGRQNLKLSIENYEISY